VPMPCYRNGDRKAASYDEVKREAERRGIRLVILTTAKAIDLLEKEPADTNAILHVTC